MTINNTNNYNQGQSFEHKEDKPQFELPICLDH